MSKKEKKSCPEKNCRLGKVGGQAVLEGVMMKAGSHVVTTCRKEDKSLVVVEEEYVSARKKHKILNIPILRGVINFVETLVMSMKTLENSADALGLDEEEETKFEKWLKKRFGIGIVPVIMAFSIVLGLALSVALFIFLPRFLVNTVLDRWILTKLFDKPNALGLWAAVIEGGFKIVIFLLYLWLVSLMPDIKRVFMYHGAEHKSIACFESGEELTPANAMRHTRFHPRCGTSFMFFMILLGVIVGLFIRMIFPNLHNDFAYTGIRLLLLPLVVGIGFEFIMYAGKHENFITKTLSAPGLWVQRLTTKEPTEDMLECAITSLKCAMRDEVEEFAAFREEKPWLAKEEPTEAAEPETAEKPEAADAPVETVAEVPTEPEKETPVDEAPTEPAAKEASEAPATEESAE